MIDWTRTAFIFPGQGSQHVGMGADLAEQYPEAAAAFAEADSVLAFPLSRLCFEGPEADLNNTVNTQPALFVMGIAILRAKRPPGGSAQAALRGGTQPGRVHRASRGWRAGFRRRRAPGPRARASDAACRRAHTRRHGGRACSWTRTPCADLRRASLQTGKPLVLANDNCDGQLVISGDDRPRSGAALATERGAKRVVPLAVSVASHSPLMESITPAFRQTLAATAFDAPAVPVIGNVTAAPLTSADAIRDELGAQLTSTVRWTESVQYMRGQGIDTFIEVGPKDVLTGLVKRIDRAAERVTLQQRRQRGGVSAAQMS